MTKLPAKLFCDFSRNGALSRILCCALQYKNEQVARSDCVAPLCAQSCARACVTLSMGQGWKASGFEKNLLGEKAHEHTALFTRIEMDLLNAQLLRCVCAPTVLRASIKPALLSRLCGPGL